MLEIKSVPYSMLSEHISKKSYYVFHDKRGKPTMVGKIVLNIHTGIPEFFQKSSFNVWESKFMSFSLAQMRRTLEFLFEPKKKRRKYRCLEKLLKFSNIINIKKRRCINV